MTLQDGVTRVITYGILLLQNSYGWADAELRYMVARCLAHNPADRPSLDELLRHAKENIAKTTSGALSSGGTPYETDQDLETWCRYIILGAPDQ